jgi:peptidylprolyl isomerase
MQLDKKYTVFGRVIEGMQYVDTIAPGEPPANPTTILQASIESDGKAPVMALPAPAAPSIVAPPTARKSVAPKKR